MKHALSFYLFYYKYPPSNTKDAQKSSSYTIKRHIKGVPLKHNEASRSLVAGYSNFTLT